MFGIGKKRSLPPAPTADSQRRQSALDALGTEEEHQTRSRRIKKEAQPNGRDPNAPPSFVELRLRRESCSRLVARSTRGRTA